MYLKLCCSDDIRRSEESIHTYSGFVFRASFKRVPVVYATAAEAATDRVTDDVHSVSTFFLLR